MHHLGWTWNSREGFYIFEYSIPTNGKATKCGAEVICDVAFGSGRLLKLVWLQVDADSSIPTRRDLAHPRSPVSESPWRQWGPACGLNTTVVLECSRPDKSVLNKSQLSSAIDSLRFSKAQLCFTFMEFEMSPPRSCADVIKIPDPNCASIEPNMLKSITLPPPVCSGNPQKVLLEQKFCCNPVLCEGAIDMHFSTLVLGTQDSGVPEIFTGPE